MWVGSVVAALLLFALTVAVWRRLDSRGQLDARLWRPLGQWPVIRFLLLGLVNTLKAAVVAMVGAIVVGFLAALARLARRRPVRWLATAYVQLFRGLPQLVLILFSALALPRLGVDLALFWYLVLGLTVYNGAVLGEIIRAGILSLDRGQSEAAKAIGLGYWQGMLFVVLPQAVRRMIPSVVSQLVTLLKDTSLGLVIAYEELLRRAQIVGEQFRDPLQAVAVASVLYIVVNGVLSLLARRLEVRQRRRYRAAPVTVAGVEDLAIVAAATSP